jgi:hypothetical protein
VSAPVDWVPEVALAPDQPLDAVQDVAFVEDQVSVEDAPFATVAGLATRDTVGAVDAADPGVAELAVPPPQAESTEAITGTSSKLFARNIGILIR